MTVRIHTSELSFFGAVLWTTMLALSLPRVAHTASPPPHSAYIDAGMRAIGDVSRGRALFFDEGKTGCAKCHSVDGSSSKPGPDLAFIGDKFPRRELSRAILEPSASIAVGYETTRVETESGEEFEGVLKEVTSDGIELASGDGTRVRIAMSEIRARRGSSVSLMPEGLQAALSPREFSDVVEYLVTLKQPDHALSASRGAPPDIPKIDRPIRLNAFVSENLRFPHAYVHEPGDVRSGLVWFGQWPGASHLFVAAHQTGKVWLLEKNAGGDTKSLFADITTEVFNERGPNGLLGMAFHPEFPKNRKYYLKHQVFEENAIATVLVEREAATDLRGDSGKPSRRLLKIETVTQNHTGGCIAFGPDGCLYLAMGDTGPQRDPNGHGQNMELLLGKMLRIDVDTRDAGLPYGIPADNPFINRPGARPEIWALGFREPWRFTFDSITGDLWAGDVGQDRVEEVAIVRRGENHGWNVYEGFELFSNEYRQEGAEYVPPVFAYGRQYGNSVTGGSVYRGDKNSSFYGVYICGDYTSRRIFGLTQDNGVLKEILQIGEAPQPIASFGTDNEGNLYVVGYEGMIYKLDFESAVFEPASQDHANDEK